MVEVYYMHVLVIDMHGAREPNINFLSLAKLEKLQIRQLMHIRT